MLLNQISNLIRFEINLLIGENYDDLEACLVAFHFNARFDKQNTIICNYRDMEWSSEPFVSRDNPLQKGSSFRVKIIITPEGYDVSVNGTTLTVYKHKLPFQKVNHMYVNGDVDVQKIEINEKASSYDSITLRLAPRLHKPLDSRKLINPVIN